MKFRLLIILAVRLVGLAGLVLLSVTAPPVPVAILHVMDGKGRPIAGYDMPIQRGLGVAHRSALVSLTSDETSKVVVTMEKKGVETLTH